MENGEAGILLNDDAIDLVVNDIIERIKGLVIKQSKGHLSVDSITVSYSTTNQGMKHLKNNEEVVSTKTESYAVYYTPVEISDVEYKENLESSVKKGKSKKEANKKEKDTKKSKTSTEE
jgi:hypothetical protein